MRRQRAAAGLTEAASGAIARVPGSWSDPLRRSALPGAESGCTVTGRERRRLPGNALVKLRVGLGLTENPLDGRSIVDQRNARLSVRYRSDSCHFRSEDQCLCWVVTCRQPTAGERQESARKRTADGRKPDR
jgi:hypothetical protein